MSKRALVVSLLGTLIACSLAAPMVLAASQQPQAAAQRATFPARLAPVYGFGGLEQPLLSPPKSGSGIAAGSVSSQAVGIQVGATAYDYQHNCSMGHQAEHRGTDFLHFGWMNQQDFIDGGDRSVATQSYDLVNCETVFMNPKLVTADYGGYMCMDAAQNGCAVPSAHEGADSDSQRPRAYFDFCVGAPLGTFQSDYPTDIYGWYTNHGTGPGNQNLWPIIEWQIGTQTILHMITCEGSPGLGDPQTISYYRRVGDYGAGSGTWSAQKLVDTVMMINPVLAASQTTDKVAIVWNAPVDYHRDQGIAVEFNNQYENDIWYAVSTDQGASFMAVSGSLGHAVDLGAIPGANITTYDPLSPYKAYCDIAAMITGDDNLHIVWGCRRWTDTTSLYRRQGAIFHWSEDVPNIRPVVKAEWDTGGTCVGHAWGMDAAKMSIAECDSRLYVLYTQFGNAEAPCYDYSANKQVMNGELYLTVSGDHGLNWDRPQNLTNSPTPLCADGDCESDYWASMARYGRTETNGCEGIAVGTKILDILYINDKSAGGCIQTESGVWTINPVMWLPTPCRDVVAEPGYMDNAGTGFGECSGNAALTVRPNADTSVILTLENPGILPNDFAITVAYTDGSGWITADPSSGTIQTGLNNTVDVELTFSDPGGGQSGTLWEAVITVTHEAEGSPREIPICLYVLWPGNPVEGHAPLATTCTRTEVYNHGEMGGPDNAAMDFINDCDTFNINTTSTIYLYDGSTFIGRVDGGDTLRSTMYSNSITNDDGFWPTTNLTIDSTGHAAYTHAESKYRTGDGQIGVTTQYFVPKRADSSCFMVVVHQMYNLSGSTINGVVLGDVLDWDVPADSNSNNGSGYVANDSVSLIYQYGGEYNQDDSTEAFCDQESDNRVAAVMFDGQYPPEVKNARTVDNATYVYSSGPYGNAAPFPAGVMYAMMKTSEGFSTFSSTAPESLYTDLSTVVTFGDYTLAPGDTIVALKVLFVSKDAQRQSAAWWTAWYKGIMAWTAANVYPALGPATCCNVAGDANNDGKVNVGDAVYIITYVFRGGPAPICAEEGDANGDKKINVGDAVYIITYVFRGGPAPVCGG